jgi:hypothetical protein
MQIKIFLNTQRDGTDAHPSLFHMVVLSFRCLPGIISKNLIQTLK